MDVREKLVELLYEADRNCNNKQCETCKHQSKKFFCKIHFYIDHLIAHGVTVQEWNPISEPPKEKGTYLVCTGNGGVLLGHWYGTAWNAGGGAKKHLAYWMEKPQPPKGE